MKTLKKFVALMTLAALVAGPAQALAQTNPISTGLSRGVSGGSAPIVKVKWEMNAPYQSFLGTDDNMSVAGAQFNAAGTWGSKKEYSVCAVVTDPNGASDIYGVYADIYYPSDKVTHKYSDRLNYVPSESVDNPTGGCSEFIEENTLTKLSKTDGYNLICNVIRTNNTNLPTWTSGYDYDEICAADGELMKEEAYVYCDDKYLLWEEPAGNYKVEVFALDNGGNGSARLTNYFEYLPFTGFEKDFTAVSYGEVLLNTHKKISGDLTWNNAVPTVRNTGNTRAQLYIAQDDMGLGQSSGAWNVQFDGRIGNAEGDWVVFDPFKYKTVAGNPAEANWTPLLEILDLSEMEEVDFSILVKKWPDASTSYTGSMWLSAEQGADLVCP
ncbi:MAG: hypothetical protein WA103_00375 [Minisyncoccales bacterium]